MSAFVVQFLLLSVSVTLSLSAEKADPHEFPKSLSTRVFYQDLTFEIDECLNNKENGSNVCTDLQSALNDTNLVYYETDTLLNNIADIIPVIDLLLKLSTNNQSLQIMLGLRYVNYSNNYLIDNRLQDVYFSANVQLSEATKQKLATYVTSIVLTFFGIDPYSFHTSTCWEQKTRRPVVDNVKEFWKRHFGQEFQLPVGVAFSLEQQDFLFSQMQVADFLIIKTDFDITSYSSSRSSHEFRILPELLLNALEKNEKTRRLREFLKNRNTFRPVPIMWMINFKSSSWRTQEQARYNNDQRLPLYRWLLQSPSYTSAVQEFYPKWTQMCMNVFVEMGIMNNETVLFTNREKLLPSFGLRNHTSRIIPAFKQVHMIGYFPDLQRNFSRLLGTNKDVILNEETWGTIARHSKEFLGLFECGTATPFNVILEVTRGIQSSWKVLEDYMQELLWTNISPYIQINTIIFHHTDIYYSKNIQSFVNSTKALNISVGCSVPYSSFVEPYIVGSSLNSIFEKNVCTPMFDMFTTFIWLIQDRATVPNSVNYFDVFLSREIFLREFPDKKVILQFYPGPLTQEFNFE